MTTQFTSQPEQDGDIKPRMVAALGIINHEPDTITKAIADAYSATYYSTAKAIDSVPLIGKSLVDAQMTICDISLSKIPTYIGQAACAGIQKAIKER